MGSYNIDLDVLSKLPDAISGTISDFGDLEVEDLSDMISKTKQSLSEIVVRAEEKVKSREVQLRLAIQARINAEEMARSSEDSSMEVSSGFYEREMRCREELEHAREVFEHIRNLPLSYDDLVAEYNNRIENIKVDYEQRIRESNRDLSDYIEMVIHQHREGGIAEDIGDPYKVGYLNEALGKKSGETKTLTISKPSGEVFSTVTDLADGKCYKMTSIPTSFVALSLTSDEAPSIKGPVSIVKNNKGIKYRIRERRPASPSSKQFPGVHLFQYPSIATGSVEQFDDFLKNDLRNRAPFSVSIPANAYITAEQMNNGYDQVKYEWNDANFDYTCRWHTPTKEELMDQGDTWILHRSKKDCGEQKSSIEYFVSGKWIPKSDFLKSDEFRKLGHIKDHGEFISILENEV